MNDKYILNLRGDAVLEPDVIKWGRWFEVADRKLAYDEIDGVKISTVFLGLDHNFGKGKPLLWETMIFGGENDQYQDRYSTKEEALKGHKKALKIINNNY